MKSQTEMLAFYTQQSFFTDPQEHKKLLSQLPDDLVDLCKAVQGLIIHQYWATAYGYEIPEERQTEYQIRNTADKLTKILAMNDQPITEARPPSERIVGNCRDFSIMLTTFLRFKGVPARVRCGFATYFTPPQMTWYEDHLVCEIWDETIQQWRLVDAQLDDLQRKSLRIDFDTTNVPRDKFLTGGQAWRLYRSGEVSPDSFGYGDTIGGEPNIRGNLIRDVAFLNRVEILGWDFWGSIEAKGAELSEDDLGLLDEAAELSGPQNENFDKLRALYIKDMRLRVPLLVKRYQADDTFVIEDILDGNYSLAKHL